MHQEAVILRSAFILRNTIHRALQTGSAERTEFQLRGPRDGQRSAVLAWSPLGPMELHNRLPPRVIEATSVSEFRQALQDVAEDRAAATCVDWGSSLSPRALPPIRSWSQPCPSPRQLTEAGEPATLTREHANPTLQASLERARIKHITTRS